VAVVGYRLDRDGSHIATLPGTATTFTDANRRPETTYRYALRALDAAGHLGPATTVTATTLPPDLNPPSAPDWLRATAGEASVWLGWGAASDAEGGLRGYRISRDGSVVATTGAATRSWTDGSRRPGTYVYAVAAIDLAGNVGPALTRTVTVLGPDSSAPTVPGSLVVTAGATSATLRWTSADDDVGVTGYTIWRGGVVVATVASWARSWRDADLAPGVYEYAVAAFDEAGNIGPARIGAATVLGPDATPPSAPAALRLDDVRRRSVRLAWEPATDDVGVVLYRVYRDGRLVDVTYDTSAWDRPGAGTYSYTVTAVDAAGNESPPSVPLEIQLGG
jgi:hypothetical protein